MNTSGLSPWLLSPNGSGEKQSTCDIGSGNPEDGELQVPGTEDITREVPRQIHPVEVPRIGSVVGGAPSHQHLPEKEQSRESKILDRRPLASRRNPWNHLGVGMARL